MHLFIMYEPLVRCGTFYLHRKNRVPGGTLKYDSLGLFMLDFFFHFRNRTEMLHNNTVELLFLFVGKLVIFVVGRVFIIIGSKKPFHKLNLRCKVLNFYYLFYDVKNLISYTRPLWIVYDTEKKQFNGRMNAILWKVPPKWTQFLIIFFHIVSLSSWFISICLFHSN